MKGQLAFLMASLGNQTSISVDDLFEMESWKSQELQIMSVFAKCHLQQTVGRDTSAFINIIKQFPVPSVYSALNEVWV